MTTKRRFEILLPVLDNDGNIQTADKFARVENFLLDRFGGFTKCGRVAGEWRNENAIYRDELVKVCVDVDDTPANHATMFAFKDCLKKDFNQLDIYITTFIIQTI